MCDNEGKISIASRGLLTVYVKKQPPTEGPKRPGNAWKQEVRAGSPSVRPDLPRTARRTHQHVEVEVVDDVEAVPTRVGLGVFAAAGQVDVYPSLFEAAVAVSGNLLVDARLVILEFQAFDDA